MSVSYTTLLSDYQDALQAIATGQSYELGGRKLTRANLKEVMAVIDWLEEKVQTQSQTQMARVARRVRAR